MDTADDLTYLNYLGSKTDTFLLQSSAEPLGVQDPTLNSHTIFGELDDGGHIWTIDNLPVLLNGAAAVSDDQTDVSQVNLNADRNEDVPETCIGSSEELSYPIEIPGEAYITSNGLFLTNEVLLQMNLQNDVETTEEETQEDINVESNNGTEILMNGSTDVYNVNSKVSETYIHMDKTHNMSNRIISINDLNTNADLIQLLNTDGTIINIDKNILINNNGNESDRENEKVYINENFEKITAYKCKKCGYLAETLFDMLTHSGNKLCPKNLVSTVNSNKPKLKSLLNVNDKNKQKLVLLCSECNQGYSSAVDLKKHMIKEHHLSCNQTKAKNEKNATSNHKDHSIDSRKQEYLNIIKTQQKARKIKCSVKGCESRFASEEYRIRHEQCHVDSQKKQFQCTVCNKKFTIWRICSLHLWKCHEIDSGLLSCVLCNYKTLSPHKLWPHMLTHEEKNYLCNECGKHFKQVTQLRNHQVSHLRCGEGIPNWISQQQCKTCGNIFSDSKSLKKHIQGVHNKFKPYVCNICGHKTARKAMLELHLRQHTGEKPYVCHWCTYKTGDHNTFRRHLMRHSGGKKYSCPHCSYQSIQSVAYKHHISTKHPGEEGVLNCTYCNFQSVNETVFRTHIKQHEVLANGNKVQEEERPRSEEIVKGNATKINKKVLKLDEDEETQHGFLSAINNDETVDTGGITIPAELEVQI